MRKIISKIALAFAIFGCLGSGVARAGNISLDVTASNISGVASKDPYSRKEAKGDNDQKLLSDMTEKYAVVEDIRNSVDEIQKKMEQISIEQKE